MFTNETGDISGTVISGCDIPDWNQVVGGKGMIGFSSAKKERHFGGGAHYYILIKN